MAGQVRRAALVARRRRCAAGAVVAIKFGRPKFAARFLLEFAMRGFAARVANGAQTPNGGEHSIDKREIRT